MTLANETVASVVAQPEPGRAKPIHVAMFSHDANRDKTACLLLQHGIAGVFTGTLEEAKAWLNNDPKYYYDLFIVEVSGSDFSVALELRKNNPAWPIIVVFGGTQDAGVIAKMTDEAVYLMYRRPGVEFPVAEVAAQIQTALKRWS